MKRIAVVGAGAAGLPAIKSCLEENFQVVCFERTENIGGLWCYQKNLNIGQTCVMKSTVMNTSKEFSAFSDFPPPSDFPTYMHNSKFMEYLHLYAIHFDILKHIRFQHEVINVARTSDYSTTGKWKIQVRDLQNLKESEDVFDGVLICTGFQASPKMAKYPSLEHFKGQVIHANAYREPDLNLYEDKSILVIGMGNSGCDVAVELSTISKKMYLSTRRGGWVASRKGPFGYPSDHFMFSRVFDLIKRLFPETLRFVLESFINLLFDHKLYNLKPAHDIFSKVPTINDLLPVRVISGSVIIKNDVKRFTEDNVIFEGEEYKEYPVDVVILATGYEPGYPILEEELKTFFKENDYHFYQCVFPPNLEHASLAFIGKGVAIASAIAVYEMECRWFVQLMTGRIKLPEKTVMLQDIANRTNKLNKEIALGNEKSYELMMYRDIVDTMAEQFGVKPNLLRLIFSDFKLFRKCFFGPLVAYQFRLQGPHSWPGAREAILNVDKRISSAFNTRQASKRDLMKKNNEGYNLFKFFCILLIAYFGMYFFM